MKKIKPQVMVSPLTGNYYYVKALTNDGAAYNKVDVTDSVKAFIREETNCLEDAAITYRAFLQKARDLIEFSPIFGTEATKLVCDIDSLLKGKPVEGRWRPEITCDSGGLFIQSLKWEEYLTPGSEKVEK